MTGFSLTGTRAFVTGANTGIGQAIAVDLAPCEQRGHYPSRGQP